MLTEVARRLKIPGDGTPGSVTEVGLRNETRLELALQLLESARLPVSNIAAALQYADSNAFSPAFQG
jgi:AraC-like DNA-binding protein